VKPRYELRSCSYQICSF